MLRAVMPLSRTSGEKVVQTYMIVGRDDGAGYNVELTDAIGVHHHSRIRNRGRGTSLDRTRPKGVNRLCSSDFNYGYRAADRCCLILTLPMIALSLSAIITTG